MAIGNAPWPIGVTMVGIHARTGREKIFAQQIAHVLNDETQRKYIQVRTMFGESCRQERDGGEGGDYSQSCRQEREGGG